MKRLSTIRKCILAGGLVLGLGAVLLYSYLENMLQADMISGEEEVLTFSRDSGFYAESITVDLKAQEGAEIYYTVDGSKPAMDSSATKKYEEGIYIPVKDAEYTCTVRAVVYKDGVMRSGIESRTYLMGENVTTRFDMPVLSVTGNPEDFYGYEDGIMVHGKRGDEFLAEHPEWKELYENNMVQIFGNRYQKGREAEREVFVTLFDKQGSPIFSQDCGFRVCGEASRMKNQPSFRLYARSEYDEDNDFDYIFFEDQYTNEGTLQSDFKRIIVRNSGNDNGYAFIRSELATTIAKEAGFKDTPSASPVCVYLNGNYYGVLWFTTNFDDGYFRESYGDYTGEMYIFEGEVDEVEWTEEEEDTTYTELAKEYGEAIDRFEDADLTDDATWESFNAILDMDNFIKTLALNNYIGNDDSFLNNYRVYRYYSPTGEYTPGTVFDGRYRLLLFDLDKGLGLVQKEETMEPVKYMLTTERIWGEEEIFSTIFRREECRELYIKYILSLMNYYYSANHVEKVMDEMHAERASELKYMIENTDYLINNFYAPDVTEFDYVLEQMEVIKEFTVLRPEYVLQDLQTAFGEMTTYTLQMYNPEQAYITLDYASLSETEMVGTYFEEVPVQISAQPRPGYRFGHWLVNGERVDDISFEVASDMIAEGLVDIICVCEPDEEAELCISGVKSRSGDFIEVTNLSSESKNLGEYCLTDNFSEQKSALPGRVIAPGETITIYCKNYAGAEALGKPATNFSIKAGETVSLYHVDGTLVDSLEVPQLGSEEGIWRMDMYSGIFRETLP